MLHCEVVMSECCGMSPLVLFSEAQIIKNIMSTFMESM